MIIISVNVLKPRKIQTTWLGRRYQKELAAKYFPLGKYSQNKLDPPGLEVAVFGMAGVPAFPSFENTFAMTRGSGAASGGCGCGGVTAGGVTAGGVTAGGGCGGG